MPPAAAAPEPARPRKPLDRRRFLTLTGLAGAGAGLAGCGGTIGTRFTGRKLVVGFVTPQTGILNVFAQADTFVVQGVREVLEDRGIEINGKRHPVEIRVKDAQSDSERAAQVAKDLIDGGIDLMVCASNANVVNPVADVCEKEGVACVSTMSMFESHFLGRGGQIGKPFKWTNHFFFGTNEAGIVFTDMWDRLGGTNKVVGGLWPDDGPGRAMQSPDTGMPNFLGLGGYQVIDPGLYPAGTDDFESIIRRFMNDGVEIVSGVPSPADFATFWKQSSELGYRPKAATMLRALLFPAFIEAMGDRADALSTEVWWSPRYPYRSSLTGKTGTEMANEYTRVTRRQWIMPLGYIHVLFEVAVDTLRRCGNPDDKEAIAKAMRGTKLDTLCGRVDFTAKSNPVEGFAITPLAGGQWRRRQGQPFLYDLDIVSNAAEPTLVVTSDMRPLPPAGT